MKNVKVEWNKEKQVYEISADVEAKQDENGNYYIEDTCDYETSVTMDDIRGGKGNSIFDNSTHNIMSTNRKELISNTIIYFDLCEKYTKELIDRILSETDIELKDIEYHIHKVGNEWCFLNYKSESLCEFNNCFNDDYNVSQLKSKIKHSKNHMERIRLEQELSKLYVKRKLKK